MRPFFESVQVKIWCGRTCASAWSALLQSAHAASAAHCSRRKISLIRCKRFSRAWFHTARVAEQRQRRSARMQSKSNACPLCFHLPRQHEREGARSRGFGFQTKVKDRFLNQRRWTCWHSCRENMQVLSETASLVLLFVFVLKSLLSLPHVTPWRFSLFFLYYYYLIPQCLLNILLCISRYNTACDVSYASSYSFLLINVMLVCHCKVLFYCCYAF